MIILVSSALLISKNGNVGNNTIYYDGLPLRLSLGNNWLIGGGGLSFIYHGNSI